MKLQTHYVNAGARAGHFWLALVALIMLGPAGLGVAAGLAHDHPAAGLGLMGAALAGMIAGGIKLVWAGRPRTGVVTLTKEGVDFGSERIPRSKIESAVFTPAVGRRPPSVRILGKKERELAWLAVDDPKQGDAVLSAMGLDARRTSAQFWALAKLGTTANLWFLASLLACVAIAVGAAALIGHAAVAYFAFLPFALASAFFNPAKIHVGSDGLLYKLRVGSRFFPWSDVKGVAPTERGISIHLKNGERYDIPTVARGKMYYEYERLAQATLIARATDALAAFDRGDVPDVSARVARLGRTKEEWIAQLRDREGGFREAPLRTDDLWRVVESPGANVTARAGAAAVLAREASGEDRARLRVAADTCAEPRLRVVLDKAANGEDVMEALGDVEDGADGTDASQARA